MSDTSFINDDNAVVDGDKSSDEGASKTTDKGTSGTSLPQWVTSQLPADLHREELGPYEKPGKLVRDWFDKKEKLEAALTLPGEDATKEEWSEFYSRIGRPKAPDGYQLTTPELPDGFKLNPKYKEQVQKQAFEANLTQAQAQELYRQSVQTQIQAYNAKKDERQRLEKELNGTWGEKAEANKQIALKTLREFFDSSTVQTLTEHGLDNDPGIVKALYSIGARFMDDNLEFPAGREAEESDEVAALKARYPNSPEMWS